MKVLIIFAHPNPLSFTRAILDHFVKGIKEAGHQYEIVDLYKTKFNPIFQDMDFAFFVDNDIPKDILQQMDLRGTIIKLAGGPVKRLIAKWYIKNKTDEETHQTDPVSKAKRCFIAAKESGGSGCAGFYHTGFLAALSGVAERLDGKGIDLWIRLQAE